MHKHLKSIVQKPKKLKPKVSNRIDNVHHLAQKTHFILFFYSLPYDKQEAHISYTIFSFVNFH